MHLSLKTQKQMKGTQDKILRSLCAEQNSLAHAKSTGPRLLYMTLVAIATLQVKVFAWFPFGDQFFRFSETFLQIKSPASKFQAPWRLKWSQLRGLHWNELCFANQGANKVSFTVQPANQASCSQHILAHKTFQQAPKAFLISRIDYNPSVI